MTAAALSSTPPRAAVVGAGLAGLTSAYRLTQAGWSVQVFEAEDHPGGRVQTVAEQGYVLDTGATAIAARYPIFLELARELGLEAEPTSPYLGVVRDGRVHLLKLDELIRSGARTGLLSTRTKLRLARVVADIVWAKLRGRLSYDDLRRAASLDTETAQAYVRRRAGDEADRYLAEPLTRALLLANSDQVSRVELMSGLINAVAGELGTLAGGQAAVIDRLAKQVDTIHLDAEVTEVVPDGAGVQVTGRGVGIETGEDFDACVVACPLPVATRLCGAWQPELGALNDRLRFTRAINVAFGTTRPPDTEAFLVQLPREEDAEICMVVVENNKLGDRAPQGHGLVTLSWEMSAARAWFERSDDEVIARSRQTLTRLFPELDGCVDYTYVRRWPVGLPHTLPGVYQAIARFTAAIDPAHPVQFAGDYLSQTGQNTAVAWGQRAAHNLITQCPTTTTPR